MLESSPLLTLLTPISAAATGVAAVPAAADVWISGDG